MATSESELIDEVRVLTGYDASLISDSDFSDLVGIAKDEIQADVGQSTTLSFFGSETLSQDMALFWLTCLFSKIKAGEIGAADFRIADLEVEPLSGESNFWFRNFKKRQGELEAAQGFASGSLSREDDREYSYE